MSLRGCACAAWAVLVLAPGCSGGSSPDAGQRDLSSPSDLSSPPDLATPDLATPDLSTPDLAPAGPQVIVVMQSALRGWSLALENTATGAFSAGPDAAPLALGGFRMPTGAGTGAGLGGKSWLLTSALSGTPLAQIDALSYRTYVRAGSTAAAQLAVAVDLQIDADGDGARDTTLVFEPVFSPEQGAVTKGTWQRWDAAAGRWWATVATSAFCAAGCRFTLAEFVAAHPKATIVNWGDMPSVALVSGQHSGGDWANFDGDVDEFSVSKGGVPSKYDFEPEASACANGGFAASKVPLFSTLEQCSAYHR